MRTSTAYQHLSPNGPLPGWSASGPFRCVVVIQAEVTSDWRNAVSDWLIREGCLYMMAWGTECILWNDAVDDANLSAFDYGDVPADKFVMTTWHENQPMSEVFWFAKELANHPTITLNETLVLHIAPKAAEKELLAAFEDARD